MYLLSDDLCLSQEDAENARRHDETWTGTIQVSCPARAIHRESGAMCCKAIQVVVLLRHIWSGNTEINTFDYVLKGSSITWHRKQVPQPPLAQAAQPLPSSPARIVFRRGRYPISSSASLALVFSSRSSTSLTSPSRSSRPALRSFMAASHQQRLTTWVYLFC